MREGDVVHADMQASACDDGFVAVVTQSGRRGLVPASYVQLAVNGGEGNAAAAANTPAASLDTTVVPQPLVIVRTSHRVSRMEKPYRYNLGTCIPRAQTIHILATWCGGFHRVLVFAIDSHSSWLARVADYPSLNAWFLSSPITGHCTTLLRETRQS